MGDDELARAMGEMGELVRPVTAARASFHPNSFGFAPGEYKPANLAAVEPTMEWHAMPFHAKKSVALSFMDHLDMPDIPFVDRFLRIVAPGLGLFLNDASGEELRTLDCFRMDSDVLREFFRLGGLPPDQLALEQQEYNAAKVANPLPQPAGAQPAVAPPDLVNEADGAGDFMTQLRESVRKTTKNPMAFFKSRLIHQDIYPAMQRAWSVYLPLKCSRPHMAARVRSDATDELKKELLCHDVGWEAWALLTISPLNHRKGVLGGSRGITTKESKMTAYYAAVDDDKAIRDLLRLSNF